MTNEEREEGRVEETNANVQNVNKKKKKKDDNFKQEKNRLRLAVHAKTAAFQETRKQN